MERKEGLISGGLNFSPTRNYFIKCLAINTFRGKEEHPLSKEDSRKKATDEF